MDDEMAAGYDPRRAGYVNGWVQGVMDGHEHDGLFVEQTSIPGERVADLSCRECGKQWRSPDLTPGAIEPGAGRR